MIAVSHNSLRWIQFTIFQPYPDVAHGVFMRYGGVSPFPFKSLNVGLTSEDSRENITRNETIIRESLQVSSLVRLKQTHGDRIWEVDEASVDAVPKADAMVTNTPGLGLMVQVADCQSVLLFDPRSRCVANVHSGWRGSLLNIVGKTVRRMARVFGAAPASILAGIGPSLGPCCAEFRDYKRTFPETMDTYHIGRNHFNFWSLTKDQLLECGVSSRHIESSGMCTKCGSLDFFSYRREKVTGRFASVVGLRSQ